MAELKVEILPNPTTRHFFTPEPITRESVRGGTRRDPFRHMRGVSVDTLRVIDALYTSHPDIATVSTEGAKVTIEARPDADWDAIQPGAISAIKKAMNSNGKDVHVTYVFNGVSYAKEPVDQVTQWRQRAGIQYVYERWDISA